MNLSAYAHLPTEKINSLSGNLDLCSPLQVIRLMNRDEQSVLRALKRAERPIAKAAAIVAISLFHGHRFFLAGAGTSGRLGVLEAAECPPTFNTDPSQVQALMAGGRSAVFQSKEGAEDSVILAKRDMRPIRRGDVLLGIAASGVTPYVQSALTLARRRGAKTILLTCNPQARVKGGVDVAITLRTGPEILSGSTRLKAGTACKLALNRITLAAMVQLGKVYGNRMVDLQPKSRKLVARGLNLIQELGQVSFVRAKQLFKASHGQVKPAILMGRKNWSYSTSMAVLARVQGSLREALKTP